jgi:hypothetical protein
LVDDVYDTGDDDDNTVPFTDDNSNKTNCRQALRKTTNRTRNANIKGGSVNIQFMHTKQG